LDQKSAEIVAIQSLSWIATAELLDTFQSATGVDEAQIRAAAGDPAFLAAVLDFIFNRDDWVLAAAEAQSIPPEDLARARAALPGGGQVHWT
jgi:hypothetical protein